MNFSDFELSQIHKIQRWEGPRDTVDRPLRSQMREFLTHPKSGNKPPVMELNTHNFYRIWGKTLFVLNVIPIRYKLILTILEYTMWKGERKRMITRISFVTSEFYYLWKKQAILRALKAGKKWNILEWSVNSKLLHTQKKTILKKIFKDQ